MLQQEAKIQKQAGLKWGTGHFGHVPASEKVSSFSVDGMAVGP